MLQLVNLTATNRCTSGFPKMGSRLRWFIILMFLCISTQYVFGRGLFERGKSYANPPSTVEESGTNSPEYKQGDSRSDLSGEKPAATRPTERPEWVTILPQNKDILYIVGKSVRIDSERAARSNAQENGRIQTSQYVADQQSEENHDATTTVSIKGVKVKSYYTEIYLDKQGYKQYVVYALMAIDRKKLSELQEESGVEGEEQ